MVSLLPAPGKLLLTCRLWFSLALRSSRMLGIRFWFVSAETRLLVSLVTPTPESYRLRTLKLSTSSSGDIVETAMLRIDFAAIDLPSAMLGAETFRDGTTIVPGVCAGVCAGNIISDSSVMLASSIEIIEHGSEIRMRPPFETALTVVLRFVSALPFCMPLSPSMSSARLLPLLFLCLLH